MDKRLVKRHKRKVSRQRARKKVSEPHVRTPEEIRAAKEPSRPSAGRQDEVHASHWARIRSGGAPATETTSKFG
jgi:hypothetical protein